MAYIPFDPTKPDGASQNGAAFASSIRTNEAALRDGVIMLTFRGWSMTVNGANKEIPSAWVYEKGTEGIKALPTYIVGGVASGMISRMLYTYTSNTWGSFTTVGAENYTYNASADFVSAHWST